MDNNGWVAAIVTALGGSAGVAALGKAIFDLLGNKVESEKAYNRRMIQEARDNDARADMEYSNKRRWQEYAWMLKRIIIENGLYRELPEEPVDDKCPTRE